MHGDKPAWSVTDNTIRALLRRGLATVTHTRDCGRPAVVRVKSKSEIVSPLPLTVVIDGVQFCGFTAPDPVSVQKLFVALRDRQFGAEVVNFRMTAGGAEISLTVDGAEAA
jgi:hypothetical protein